MGFLKVFRWILFGFALLFGLTTLAFASYYFLPDGPLLDALKEYLTSSEMTIETVLGTYGFLAAASFVLFIIFSIIVSKAKKRRRYNSNNTYSSQSNETPNKQGILFVSDLGEDETLADYIEQAPFIAAWDEDTLNPTLSVKEDGIAIGDDTAIFMVFLKKNNIIYKPNNPDNYFDNYPTVSLAPCLDNEDRSFLIVSNRDVIPSADSNKVFEVLENIHNQTAKNVKEITPVDGSINCVVYLGNGVKDFIATLKKRPLVEMFKEWSDGDYLAFFERIIINIIDNAALKKYMQDVFEKLHGN